MLDDITPIVLSYNEAPNLARMLRGLRWARRVVLVDSLSTDATLEIAAGFDNVEVFERAFDNHAAQWQFALTATGVDTPWVLCMDADWIMPPALVEELAALAPPQDVAAYEVGFRYCVYGEPLRASLYPPVKALFRRTLGRFEQDGHTQRVRVTGGVGRLRGQLDHDDRKSLSRWLWAQDRYARLEVERMGGAGAGGDAGTGAVSWKDRLRRALIITPWLVPLHFLVVRRGLLDGPAGWFYAAQRAAFEVIVVLHLVGARWPEARRGGEADTTR